MAENTEIKPKPETKGAVGPEKTDDAGKGAETDQTQVKPIPPAPSSSDDYNCIKDVLDLDRINLILPGLIKKKMIIVKQTVETKDFASTEFREAIFFIRLVWAGWKEFDGRIEIRKVTANTLVRLEACALFYKAITALDSLENAKDESGKFLVDYWRPYYNMWAICWNTTDSSRAFAEHLCATENFLSHIRNILTSNIDDHIQGIQNEQMSKLTQACLSITYNCCLFETTRDRIEQNDFVSVLHPYLSSPVDHDKTSALVSMAYLLDEQQSSRFLADSSQMKYLISFLEGTLDCSDRRYRGWTSEELLKALARIAVNDTNKKGLVAEGILPVLAKVVESSHLEEQRGATENIWILSFDNSNKDKIIQEQGMVDLLQRLKESPDETVRRHCNGALWVLREKLTSLSGIAGKLLRKKPKGSQSDIRRHVMISYQWNDQDVLIKVKDKLTARGFRIWMDIENMHGSTLQAMAEAIEHASVVLICMSKKYKDSPNCRAEAEYAYQLRKDIIPLKTESNYSPDGWLGFLMGTKLYFDFSGKFTFDDKLEELIREFRHKINSKGSNSESQVAIIPNHVEPVRTHGGIAEQKTWTRVELDAMIEKHLPLSSKIKSLDSEELVFLRDLRIEAPEFFYRYLEARLELTELSNIIKFTKLLREL